MELNNSRQVSLKQRMTSLLLGTAIVFSSVHVSNAAEPEIVDAIDSRLASLQTEEARRRITDEITKYHDIMSHNLNEITVFIGGTGAGKTTAVNILGGYTMKPGIYNTFETEESGRGFEIGASAKMVTLSPNYLQSPDFGFVVDMPGFEDTNGAAQDIINGAFLHYILTNAKLARAVLTVSHPELDAHRGYGLIKACRHIEIFLPQFLNESLLLLVTKVNQDDMPNEDELAEWLENMFLTKEHPYDPAPADVETETLLRHLIVTHRIGAVYKPTRADSRTSETFRSFQEDAKRHLERKITTLTRTNPNPINISAAFNHQASQAISDLYESIFLQNLKRLKRERWPQRLEAVGGNLVAFAELKPVLKDEYIKEFDQSEIVQFLKPLTKAQYEEIIQRYTAMGSNLFDLEVSSFIAERQLLQQAATNDILQLQATFATQLSGMRAQIEGLRDAINGRQVSGADLGFRPYIDGLREVANRHCNREHANFCLSYSPDLEGKSPIHLTMAPLSADNPDINLTILRGGISQLRIALQGAIDAGNRNISRLDQFRKGAFASADIHMVAQNKSNGLALIRHLDPMITNYKNIVGSYSSLFANLDQMNSALIQSESTFKTAKSRIEAELKQKMQAVKD